jgi:tetratricopeptide (TPR) repeat protein
MGRFQWLEFDDKCGPKVVAAPDDQGVDEAVCLERADRLFREESYERALYFYSLALRYQVNLERAWAGQVRCLLAVNEDVEARTWAERGLDRFPGSADLLAARGVALARTRGPTAGIRSSDQALEAHGGTEYVWLSRAEVLLLAGAPEAAARCCSKALEVAGSDWYCNYNVGRIFESAGDTARAVTHFAQAAQCDPKQPLPRIRAAECRERMGDVQGAKTDLYRALQLRPGDRDLRRRLQQLDHVGWLRRMWRTLVRR